MKDLMRIKSLLSAEIETLLNQQVKVQMCQAYCYPCEYLPSSDASGLNSQELKGAYPFASHLRV